MFLFIPCQPSVELLFSHLAKLVNIYTFLLPIMTLRIVDSTAPFDFFAKNGYYQIGDAVALHVGPACQEATRSKQPIHWNFNEEVYNNFNWRSRLNLPITELYRIRAQQLRDKYDYLILWFSGGADSTTILQSFVDNGIHLDEVMVAWPRSQTAGKYTPSLNIAAENMLSEWDYSIEPKLKWLEKNYPNVKITVLDQLANPDRNEDYADTWTIVEKNGLATIDRQRLMDNALKDRYKKYKNIASISGSAPPEIHIMDNRWLAVSFFSEYATAGTAKSDYLLDGTPRNVEFFFWTPDLPELIREQGHIILDHLNSNPADKSIFLQYEVKNHYEKLTDSQLLELRRILIKKLVYPQWDMSTFQVSKPKNAHLYSTQYNWFYANPGSNYYLEGWHAAIKSQLSMIDPAIMENKNNEIYYPRFRSKFYPIGRLNS